MTIPHGKHLFISHSSEDRVIAEAVCQFLEGERRPCWASWRDIPGGEFYQQSLYDALSVSKGVVLLESRKSAQSPHVLRECEIAFRLGIPVLRLLTDREERGGGFSYLVAGVQTVSEQLWPTLDAKTRLLERTIGSGADHIQLVFDRIELRLLQEVFVAAGFSIEEARRRVLAELNTIDRMQHSWSGSMGLLGLFGRLPFFDAPEREPLVRTKLEGWVDYMMTLLKGECSAGVIWPKPGEPFRERGMLAISEWSSKSPNYRHTPLEDRRVVACIRPGVIVVGPVEEPSGTMPALVRLGE